MYYECAAEYTVVTFITRSNCIFPRAREYANPWEVVRAARWSLFVSQLTFHNQKVSADLGVLSQKEYNHYGILFNQLAYYVSRTVCPVFEGFPFCRAPPLFPTGGTWTVLWCCSQCLQTMACLFLHLQCSAPPRCCCSILFCTALLYA